jgi:natural product precursor
MKILKEIKLDQLSKIELEKCELNALKGGNDYDYCICDPIFAT